MPSSHLILCRPLLLLPPIPPSIRVFSNESTLRMRWPEYWSFSFSISPSSEHPGLISFRMDWLDLLAVQGTLKSLLQHHSSKAHPLCAKISSKSWSHTNEQGQQMPGSVKLSLRRERVILHVILEKDKAWEGRERKGYMCATLNSVVRGSLSQKVTLCRGVKE